VLVVDVQEAFAPVVAGFDAMVDRIALLVRGARLLGVPVGASEQYPHGLGPTVGQVVDAAGGHLDRVEKLEFDATSAADWQRLPAAVREAEQVVLAGIEAHVCVRHTAVALLAAGRDVHVCVDAIGSRIPLHREVALRELVRAGARETTVEQVLFDLVGAAGTDEFRALQRLLLA
jgi:nicotinamidase-related amidase